MIHKNFNDEGGSNHDEKDNDQENQEGSQDIKNGNKEKKNGEKVYDQEIQLCPKTKLKGLRKAILEQLGHHDMYDARLYSNNANAAKHELLVGEMATLETLGLLTEAQLDIEIFLKIAISVHGKFPNYKANIEVGPEESMDIIETRVPFFRMLS